MAAREFTITLECEVPRLADQVTTAIWTETRQSDGSYKVTKRENDSKPREWIITGIPEWAYITRVAIRDNGTYTPSAAYVFNTWYLDGLPATSERIAAKLNALDQFEGSTYNMSTLMVAPTSPVKGGTASTNYMTQKFDCTKAWLDITYEGASFGDLIDPVKFGETQTLDVTYASSKTFTNVVTHQVRWKMDADETSMFSTDLASGVLVDNETIPMSWLDYIPTEFSGPATCELQTYIDGEDVGYRTYGFTCYTEEEDVAPTATPTVEVINEYLTGCPDLYQFFSKARIGVDATLGQGATIVSSVISGEGQSATDADLVTDIFQTSGSKTYTLTIVDSRGLSDSADITFTVNAASKPTITTFNVTRDPDDATKMFVTIECSADPCGGYNHLTDDDTKITYCAAGSTTVLGNDTVPVSGTSYTTTDDPSIIHYTFSSASGYTFEFELHDCGTVSKKTVNVIASHVNLYLSASNYGVAVGELSSATAANPKFEVAYPSFYDRNMTVDGTLNSDYLRGNGANVIHTNARYLDISEALYQVKSVPYGTGGTAGYLVFEKG